MKKLIILAVAAIATLTTFGQGFKAGYTNVEYVLEAHPKMKEIQSQLDTEKNILSKQIQVLNQEFQTKLQQYQQGEAMMSDMVKGDKQKELQSLQSRIEDMQQNAQYKLMQKQEELLSPVLEEVEKAINQVGAENGYDFIFNGATGDGTSIILYAKSKGDNITVKIFEKLGIPVPEELKKELEK